MTRQELKAKLPHGYGKVIAEKANVSEQTVSQFFKGNNDNIKVELACLEIVAELFEKKALLLARIAN